MSEYLTSVLPPKKKMGLGIKVLIGILVFFAFLIILGAALGQNSTSAPSVAPASTPFSTAAPSTPPPAKPSPTTTVAKKSGIAQDKSFRLESISFNTDLGSAGAAARITNMSDTSKTAVFDITIFAADNVTVAAVLSGSAQEVSPGQTVTVQMVSMSAMPTGRFKFSFQVSTEF